MNNNKKNITDLIELPINHGTGFKKVFIRNEDDDTALTQFAYSHFKSGEYCELHSHPTMDEYFFVYKAGGTYHIGDESVSIKEGDFIKIPANTDHKLYLSENDSNLELVYFGIDTDFRKGK